MSAAVEEETTLPSRKASVKSVMRQSVQLSKTKANRVVFKYLPSFCSNDLVEGSWWFVWGSLLSAAVACIPLADLYLHFFSAPEETQLEAFNENSTWILAIVMGVFFTLGAFAFVRAFDEPAVPPLFSCYHIGTDELLGAWLTFFGCTPALLYCIMYVAHKPTDYVYWGGFVASLLFNMGAAFFVYTCYEGSVERRPYTFIVLRSIAGNRHLLKHVANDWLAACWFFFLCSLLWTVGSAVYLSWSRNERQDFIYASSLADALLFTIGSAYFVAGSYPIESTSSSSNNASNGEGLGDDYEDTTAPMHRNEAPV